MKKTYIIPVTEIEVIRMVTLQATSGVKGLMNDSLDIGYGGVDENGDLTPSANSYNQEWEDNDWDTL